MQKSEELKLPEPDKKIMQSEIQHVDHKLLTAQQKPDEEQKHTDPAEPLQIPKQVIDPPVVAEVLAKELAPAKHRGRPPKNNKTKAVEQVSSTMVCEPVMTEKIPSET